MNVSTVYDKFRYNCPTLSLEPTGVREAFSIRLTQLDLKSLLFFFALRYICYT